MFGLMIAMAQAVVVSPSPPPIIAPPAPPPPIVAIRSPMAPRANFQPRPPITVRVRATAGSVVLVADRFRVGPTNASFSQQRNEAAPTSCGDYRDSSRRTSINFSVGPAYSSEKEQYRVSLSWSRPGGEICGAGQRTTSVEQTVALQPGRTIVVEGDGGLKVELTRE